MPLGPAGSATAPLMRMFEGWLPSDSLRPSSNLGPVCQSCSLDVAHPCIPGLNGFSDCMRSVSGKLAILFWSSMDPGLQSVSPKGPPGSSLTHPDPDTAQESRTPRQCGRRIRSLLPAQLPSGIQDHQACVGRGCVCLAGHPPGAIGSPTALCAPEAEPGRWLEPALCGPVQGRYTGLCGRQLPQVSAMRPPHRSGWQG